MGVMPKNIKAFGAFFAPALFIVITALIGGQLEKEAVAKENFVATISGDIEAKRIDRELILTRFFEKYNSPLMPHVKTFVEVADKYKIDFRLLPAISCIESSCGKRLIPGSYNPFGWGIYGDNVIRFVSYDEAIEKVGEGLNKGYFAKGLNTPEKIAPVYTPPSHVHWLGKVKYFMNEMDQIQESLEI
ncbi:hypothetical protein C4561_02305 [candidate division WWE3 bacterium]|jgi:hypothetical protein|uniref:Mannosyl-glycoprotein endo-beta-N-acetylglucosamidase-like domain-containing protein n=1 Tax=candidate division WWE3 bacterium TaxID=2053526 RepID=A0A3A4ZDT9_UNCKA|nr:MAG: hypothetical protein C4561_02305 [candidate division WWE3 bacterium]